MSVCESAVDDEYSCRHGKQRRNGSFAVLCYHSVIKASLSKDMEPVKPQPDWLVSLSLLHSLYQVEENEWIKQKSDYHVCSEYRQYSFSQRRACK